MDALILVGGFGTRLRPLTFTLPKNALPIANRPLIERVMNILPDSIDKIILSMGYKTLEIKEQIDEKVDERYKEKIIYVEEPKPLGTAGAIKFAEKHLNEEFIVLNGDVLCDINIEEFISYHEKSDNLASMVLKEVEDPSRFGVAILQKDKIMKFIEKPKESKHKWINAGIYLLKKEIFKKTPKNTHSMIETDLFPKLANDHKLGGFKHQSFWIDTGTPETYFEANKFFQKREESKSFEIPFNTGKERIKHNNMNIGPFVSIGAKCHTKGLEISNSIILENVTIEEGTIIRNSIIGPDSRIGEHVLVKNSILGEDVDVSDHLHVENSKICPNKSIKVDVFDNVVL